MLSSAADLVGMCLLVVAVWKMCWFPIFSDISRFYFDQIARKELTVINDTNKLLKLDKRGNLEIIHVGFFKRSV